MRTTRVLAIALVWARRCGARRLATGSWLGGILALIPQVASAIDTQTDQIGRLTSVGNAGVRRFFEYDALGRTRRVLHRLEGREFVYTTEYGYPQNPAGKPGTVPVSMTFPAEPNGAPGELVTYGYDAGGAQRTIRTQLSGVPVQDIVKDIRRNARGQTTKVVYGNAVTRAYTYNEPGDLRLQQIQTSNSSGEVIQQYDYTFDRNGNVLAVADGTPLFAHLGASYTYDSLDQITSVTTHESTPKTFTYEYDAAGNLTQKDGSIQEYFNTGRLPHALRRVTNPGTGQVIDYQYDGNGNTTCIGPCASGTALTWNAENMAAEARQNGVVKNRKSFLGEAVWKKEEEGRTTLYLPDLMVETMNGQTRYRKYFNVFAERSTEDGALRFYHSDHLSSSSVMTDQGQAVAHRVAYMPYGEDRGATGGGFPPRRQFNFKEKESTGFYDYGARLYDPATGRWLSADTVRSDGPNRYAYVNNNPVTRTDPTGHETGRGLEQKRLKEKKEAKQKADRERAAAEQTPERRALRERAAAERAEFEKEMAAQGRRRHLFPGRPRTDVVAYIHEFVFGFRPREEEEVWLTEEEYRQRMVDELTPMIKDGLKKVDKSAEDLEKSLRERKP